MGRSEKEKQIFRTDSSGIRHWMNDQIPEDRLVARRMARVNATLQRELGALIARDLADPRIGPLTSVTAVQATRDLGVATVYVSVLGGEKERSATLEALASAAVMLREMLKRRVRMRDIPRLRFRIDDAFGRGTEMLALIDEVTRRDDEERRSREGA